MDHAANLNSDKKYVDLWHVRCDYQDLMVALPRENLNTNSVEQVTNGKVRLGVGARVRVQFPALT